MSRDSPLSVNPNIADLDTLEQLPGIGPEMARRILRARPFVDQEDLKRVPGIGPVVLDRMRPYLSFALAPIRAQGEPSPERAEQGGDGGGALPDDEAASATLWVRSSGLPAERRSNGELDQESRVAMGIESGSDEGPGGMDMETTTDAKLDQVEPEVGAGAETASSEAEEPAVADPAGDEGGNYEPVEAEAGQEAATDAAGTIEEPVEEELEGEGAEEPVVEEVPEGVAEDALEETSEEALEGAAEEALEEAPEGEWLDKDVGFEEAEPEEPELDEIAIDVEDEVDLGEPELEALGDEDVVESAWAVAAADEEEPPVDSAEWAEELPEIETPPEWMPEEAAPVIVEEETAAEPEPAAATVTRSQAIWTAVIAGAVALVLALAVSLGILAALNGGQLVYVTPAELAAVDVRVSGLAEQADAMGQDVAGLRTRVDNLEALTGRVQSLEGATEQLKSDLASVSEAMDGLAAEIDAVESEISALTQRADAVEESVQVLGERADVLEENVTELQSLTGRFQEFFGGLRDLVDSLFPAEESAE